MSTCRLCGKYEGPMFKYSVRHYAHADCGFKKWGREFLNMIPAHQIGCLPYRAIDAAGLMPEVTSRIQEIDLAHAIRRRFEQGA